MELVAALAIFGSVLLGVIWYLRSRNEMEDRVRALSAQRRAVVEQEDPFSQRVMFPAVDGFLTRITNLLPTALIARARRWLVISNSSMSMSTFMSIVLVTTTILPAVVLMLAWSVAGGPPRLIIWIMLPFFALMGFLIPMIILRRRAKNRQNAILRQLPDAIDLLTTCVEAGLSLDFAFQRVAERYTGPLGDEVNHMLRDKALGKTRREALTDMAERIDLPDVNVFVNSILQAETLGTSVGQVLRIQSRQLRIRRRQRAEQLARQAAPKMAFPLVFFILPSLFIVILGPVAINAFQTFG